jgi:hypothetical protein
MYAPTNATSEDIRAIARAANTGGGTALLVANNHNRFLAESLNIPFLIEDQPGMMSPWELTEYEGSYEEGFREYLRANDVRTVVATGVDCSGATTLEVPSGWIGIMNFASQRNSRALCRFGADFAVERIGEFLVMRRVQ